MLILLEFSVQRLACLRTMTHLILEPSLIIERAVNYKIFVNVPAINNTAALVKKAQSLKQNAQFFNLLFIATTGKLGIQDHD